MNIERYEWCVISRGRLYVAYSETDANMVRSTVGGEIYWKGSKYA